MLKDNLPEMTGIYGPSNTFPRMTALAGMEAFVILSAGESIFA